MTQVTGFVTSLLVIGLSSGRVDLSSDLVDFSSRRAVFREDGRSSDRVVFPSNRLYTSSVRDGPSSDRVDFKIVDDTKSGIDFDKYNRYDDIAQYINSLDTHRFVEVSTIGKTHEGRDILMAKVGTSPRGTATRAVFIDGGLHAREWISPATALIILRNVVDEFRLGKVNNYTAVDWYIVPVANPDGYEFSHESDRMWRKNRSPPPPQSNCFGVDLNRNVDVIGYGIGASSDPCSETYKGRAPNSEPEVEALTNALFKRRYNVRSYLTLHSYGATFLTSWGYKTTDPIDIRKLNRWAYAITSAFESVHGRKYTVQTAGHMYPAGGATDDYSKATARIPFVATLELPGIHEGRDYGFEIPEEAIRNVGEEVWFGMSVVAGMANNTPLGPDPAWQKEETIRQLEMQSHDFNL